MKKSNLGQKSSDEEIELNQVFYQLYFGRKILLIFITLGILFGLIYNLITPNNYQVKVDLLKSSNSVFSKYVKLNSILEKNPLPSQIVNEPESLVENNEKIYFINSENIFQEFLIKINKKKSIIDVVSQSKYLSSVDLNNYDNNQNYIKEKIKDFKINYPDKSQKNHQFIFNWPTFNEIEQLGNEIFATALLSVKDDILKDLINIEKYITEIKSLEIEKINNEIKYLSEILSEKKEGRIIFLKEQLEIANELQITNNILEQNDNKNNVLINTYTNNTPYYLRGSKAISKEIYNLQKRTEEQMLLTSDEYLDLLSKMKINNFETVNDLSEINKAIQLFSEEDPYDWIIYNVALTDFINLKKSYQIYILSFLFSLIIGSFYVLINNFRNKILEG